MSIIIHIIEQLRRPLLVQKELNKLKTFDSSYFIGKSRLEEDGVQNYLIFQPLIRYFKLNSSTGRVSSWKSKVLSAELIEPPSTSNISISPQFSFFQLLKQPKISYTHKKVVNTYIVYELGATGSNNSDPTLKRYLFGAITLTKNADIDKYEYSGYGIGFDRRSSFLFPGDGFGQNVLIFGANMSSSTHVDNNKKDILVLRKGPTQRLEHTLTAEKMHSINFTVTKKKFLLKFSLQWGK